MSEPRDPSKIFAYHDGEKDRYADPLLVEDRILDALDDMDEQALQDQLQSPIRKLSAEAHYKLIAAYCRAFDVQPLDTVTGKGLTTQEIIDLSARFYAWQDGLKKMAT